MFSKYYQSELAFLRGMGKEFAAAHPNLAGLLAERGGDPDVERLLEGFAFLAARIRERLDDAVPEVIHDLTEVLLPHYLRPVPACSVLEILPNPGALRARTPRSTRPSARRRSSGSTSTRRPRRCRRCSRTRGSASSSRGSCRSRR